jgi:integrase
MIKKDGKTWKIDVTVRKKRIKKKGFRTRSDAEKWISDRRSNTEEFWVSDMEKNFKTMQIRDIALPYRSYIETTRAKKSVYVIDNIIREFGDTVISKLTMKDVRAYFEQLFKTEAIGSVKLYLAYFKSLFNYSIKRQIIATNPIVTLEYQKDFRRSNVRDTVITVDQYEDFISLFDSSRWYISGIIRTLWHTGMRVSEVLGLKWEDIDFATGSITLAADRVKESATRTIGIEPELYELLSSIKSLNNKKGVNSKSYVFGITRDTPITYTTVYETYKKRVKGTKYSHVLIHDIRHSWATRKRQEGHDKEIIMIQGGWTTECMFRRYNSVKKDEVIAMSGFDREKSELITDDVAKLIEKCDSNSVSLSTLHTLIREKTKLATQHKKK